MKKLIKDLTFWWNHSKGKPTYKRVLETIYLADAFSYIWKVYDEVISFYLNVKRLAEYAPIVWKHRNWDYGFILRFEKKLYLDLYKGCYEKGHHVFSKQESRRLQVVINLIDRLEKDNYSDLAGKYLDDKYGPNDFQFDKLKSGHYRMVDTRELKLSPEQLKRYKKDLRQSWQHEKYLEKQDQRLLADYICKYSKKWWD